jgi:hypothetical protein
MRLIFPIMKIQLLRVSFIFATINLLPASKIIAVEPSLSNFNTFKNNLDKNPFKNITPIHCGLGSRTMEANLYGGHYYNHSIKK